MKKPLLASLLLIFYAFPYQSGQTRLSEVEVFQAFGQLDRERDLLLAVARLEQHEVRHQLQEAAGLEQRGGGDAAHGEFLRPIQEIAAADGGLSTVMSVNNSPDCAALLAYGSAEQKERWLKPLARGEMLGAFCLTEPQAGSDLNLLTARAEPVARHAP